MAEISRRYHILVRHHQFAKVMLKTDQGQSEHRTRAYSSLATLTAFMFRSLGAFCQHASLAMLIIQQFVILTVGAMRNHRVVLLLDSATSAIRVLSLPMILTLGRQSVLFCCLDGVPPYCRGSPSLVCWQYPSIATRLARLSPVRSTEAALLCFSYQLICCPHSLCLEWT